MYGTDRGSLGHLAPAPGGAEFLRKTWEIPAGGGSGGGGGGGVGRGVTALKRCDLTEDGVAEIVAGREDGTVSVSIQGMRALEKGRTGSNVRPWVISHRGQDNTWGLAAVNILTLTVCVCTRNYIRTCIKERARLDLDRILPPEIGIAMVSSGFGILSGLYWDKAGKMVFGLHACLLKSIHTNWPTYAVRCRPYTCICDPNFPRQLVP